MFTELIMKASSPFVHKRLPHFWKACWAISTSTSAMVLTLLLGSQLAASAQIVSDNFDDGDDVSPAPPWFHYDPIKVGSGGAVSLATWTFPTDSSGGKALRIQCAPNNGPAASLSNTRASSILTNINYTNFYVSVDITNWDNANVQFMGIMARLNQYSGVPGQLDGYCFAYINGGAATPYLDNTIAIFRINNEGSKGVPGSSVGPTANGNAEVHGVDLDPTNQYRLVFIGEGTHMEGRVYQLPDITTPIARVQADSAGESVQWTNGPVGLLTFGYYSAGLSGPDAIVDVTFDNFYCAPTPPQAITDDFNDGNDTTPAPAWTHVDPIALAGVPGAAYSGATYTFPGGGYELFSPHPLIPDAGGPRVNSVLPGIWTDFYLSVDVTDWDNTGHQLFGLIARAQNIGPGTTDAYLFTYENGNLGPTAGDFDVLRITGEGSTGAAQMEGAIPGQNSGLHLVPGNSYRFVFIGKGYDFRAKVYQLPDTSNPIKDLLAKDLAELLPNGQVGLVVANDPSDGTQHSCRARFDNFFTEVSEPRITLVGTNGTGNAVVSWPGNFASIWALQSSTNLNSGWTEVKPKDVAYAGGLNVHTNLAPMAETDNTFYRLKRIEPTLYP